MDFKSEQNFYDILEISPHSSSREIRDSYLRMKDAFQKDSLALYTLLDETEVNQQLDHVEKAYEVLSHPEKRKNYDRSIGISTPTSPSSDPKEETLFSIDRTPPMEQVSEEELFVTPIDQYTEKKDHFFDDSSSRVSKEQALKKFESEANWTGTMIQEVREQLRIPLEEIVEKTKISKRYIRAIEEEKYSELPAPVYVRGFVMQISKLLKLPYQKVSDSYMDRMKKQSS